MKILVTGSAGMVGKPTVEALEKAGHEVVTYDLKQNQNVLDTPLVAKKAAGCDAIVHLAGLPHPVPGLEFEDYFSSNVHGTNEVAAAAIKAGVPKLIYASSTAYYGAHRGFDFVPDEGGVNELSQNAVQRYMVTGLPAMNDYHRAALAYACSKVAAETVLAAYGMADRLDVIVLRLNPLMATRKPYEFGLLLYLETAVETIVKALDIDAGFEVFNVANEGVAAVDISKWQAATVAVDLEDVE